MHAGTPAATRPTGSKSIAELLGRAAEQYGAKVAARHEVDGADKRYADRPEALDQDGE
jgi:hypothetical protein